MTFMKIFLFCTFTQCVLSDPLLITTCKNAEDAECVKEVLQNFIRENSAGIPDKGVKAMDPMIFPELFNPEDEVGYTALLKNVKVTGFKDVVISEVKATKTDEEFTFKFDMTAEADVEFVKVKSGKVYTGTGIYEGSVVADVKFGYKVVKVEDNEHFYEVSPETIKCEADNFKTTFNKEMTDEWNNDPEVKSDLEVYAKKAKEMDEVIICFLVKPVLNTIIENFRVIGRSGVQLSNRVIV